MVATSFWTFLSDMILVRASCSASDDGDNGFVLLLSLQGLLQMQSLLCLFFWKLIRDVAAFLFLLLHDFM